VKTLVGNGDFHQTGVSGWQGKTMKPILFYIGVGSNIEPENNIRRALGLLQSRLSVTAVSPFFRSRAVGATAMSDFTNGVFAAQTELPPRALKFNVLRGLEREMGRVRTADKNAARPIDLDLILYGALALSEPDLTVPEAGLRRYPFVALPLLAIAPMIVLPDSGETLARLFPGRPADYGLDLLPEFSAELQLILAG
jgi:2-amino-4-hydroxy-6-hydroxymethyldihydropteridine diphosphokinase